ncbi:LON peptidase substrate-binding domain-containing protein [Hydrogenophaga soli]
MTTPLTLRQLPLFPLQTVLFPGGWLPLRIFEVRYLDMVKRCHRAQAPFGVVCLTQGQEVASAATPGTETFQPVGTLARIEQLEQPQPGLLHITCRGQQRFRVTHAQKLPQSLWVADVDMLADDLPTPVTDDLSGTVHSLQQVLHSLTTQGGDPSRLPVQPPYAWHDAGWVANRWCELLPLPNDLKHRLMSLDSPLLRLELVSDLLDKMRIDSAR